jgi:hypothetical protein
VVALTVAVALGICAVAAAIMVPVLLRNGAVPVLVVGLITLVGALAALWMIQSRRDRFLR